MNFGEMIDQYIGKVNVMEVTKKADIKHLNIHNKDLAWKYLYQWSQRHNGATMSLRLIDGLYVVTHLSHGWGGGSGDLDITADVALIRYRSKKKRSKKGAKK
jgi:hypothetical protein